MANIPTSLDIIHATMYAIDRVKKERCQDPEILKQFPGINWSSNDEHRIYPCPKGLEKCEHGKCRISTEKQCQAVSQVPYNPVDGSSLNPSCNTDSDCSNMGKNAYCEEKTGTCQIKCKKDDDCEQSNLGYSAKCGRGKCLPKHMYLEWHPNVKSGNQQGACVIGNSYLRKWCEFPATRRTSSEKGVTDVPAFKYDTETGKCKITSDYCHWMEVSYKIDDNGDPTCYETKTQKFFENYFGLGKTIFRGIKKGIQEAFNTIPHHIEKLADDRLIKRKKLIKEHFGGEGIHMYQILWKEKALEKHPTMKQQTIGFLASEVSRVHPELVKTKDGIKYISISRAELKENPQLKRLYLTCGSGNWLLDSIVHATEVAKNN